MAYSTNQLKKIIRNYIHVLDQEIPIEKVILFGSYAWGKPKPYSDIDLAIFSKKFEDKDEIKNMQFLFKKACQIDTAIEPLPFHPKDLKNPDKRTLLYQIVTKGKVIPQSKGVFK